MKPKMWPREAQESFLGEISSLEIFKMKPKMWPREAQESFLGEISSLEISR